MSIRAISDPYSLEWSKLVFRHELYLFQDIACSLCSLTSSFTPRFYPWRLRIDLYCSNLVDMFSSDTAWRRRSSLGLPQVVRDSS